MTAFARTVVVLTGAARGLGLAMTLALLKAGVHVAAVDLPASGDAMAALLKLAKQEGVDERVLPLYADITDPEACTRARDAVVHHFGAVHGLVNNAARGPQEIGPFIEASRKKFYEVDLDVWRNIIDTNINGPFCMARAIAPVLVEQGWGRIVNVVTSYTTMVAKGLSPYGPSKAALEAATVVWSRDLESTGVTVNAVLPGRASNTRMIPGDQILNREALIQPEAMGPPIVWLMSKASDGVTGHRFIAEFWDPQAGYEAAVRKCGALAGWRA